MGAFCNPSETLAVTQRSLSVSLTLEFAGEYMTQDELDQVLDSVKAKIAELACSRLERSFDRAAIVGWCPDGNRSAELIGVAECVPTSEVED